MRAATAVLILGGGVAALWASSQSAEAPLPVPPQKDIDASILRTLAEIQAKQKAGQPLTLEDIRAKEKAGVQLTQDEQNALMRAAT